jgi:hypothetical protein
MPVATNVMVISIESQAGPGRSGVHGMMDDMSTRRTRTASLLALAIVCIASGTRAQQPAPLATPGTLEDAQRAYYNGRYEAAAAMTLEPCTTGKNGLAACEVYTAALLFQVRRAMGQSTDRGQAWKRCAICPSVLTAFKTALARGQTLARERLREQPADDETRFLLGKLDLNYVWLQVGTIGRKTGWAEYKEARHSLDAVLERQPGHMRARVARAWIDYIVDSKLPWGTRWLLGGGDRERGLATVRDAAAAESDFFVRTEARFSLWDMQPRERDVAGARDTARILLRDFPENQELRRFVGANDDLYDSQETGRTPD